MAVPSSGQLRLYADIGVELGVDQSNVSLGTMSDSAGFSEPDTMSDFYGYVDAIAPSVSTGGVSSVTSSSMTISGNVTSDGGGTITERGFYFGTNSSAATSNTKYVVSGTTGGYSRSMTGLSSGTTYYWWAYATNSVGTTIGSRNQQATGLPTIPYTMVGAYSYSTVPNIGGVQTCGYPARDYGQWGSSSSLKLSSTNTLGTTVTCYAFIDGGYGFVANIYWQGALATGVTRSNPYIYIANGYQVHSGGMFLTIDNTCCTTSTQLVGCGYNGQTYVRTSASGYNSRNTLVALQPYNT